MGAKHLTLANLMQFETRLRLSPKILVIIRFGKSLWSKSILVLANVEVGDVLDVQGVPLQIYRCTVGTDEDNCEIIKLWCHRMNRKRFDPEGSGWQKA